MGQTGHTSTRKIFFLTKEGLDNLKTKLDTLLKKRFEISEKLREIDGYEKTDNHLMYDEQISALNLTEVEAAKIAKVLQHARTITEAKDPSTVQIGSTVTLRRASQTIVYTLVSPLEVDVTLNKVSEESPLGKALIGRKLGEVVQFVTPKGEKRQYEIIDIG